MNCTGFSRILLLSIALLSIALLSMPLLSIRLLLTVPGCFHLFNETRLCLLHLNYGDSLEIFQDCAAGVWFRSPEWD